MRSAAGHARRTCVLQLQCLSAGQSNCHQNPRSKFVGESHEVLSDVSETNLSLVLSE